MKDKETRNLQLISLQDYKPRFLKRSRLQALLEEASQKPVVTIIAGLGYGKTTAVTSFLLNKQQYTLWLVLTQLDNINTKIWENLCSAFHLIGKDTNGIMPAFGFPETDFAFDNFVKMIYKQLNGSDRYYLVFDGFYHITNTTILHFVEKLILIQIPNLCIFILSRKEILINTVSLRAKNLLFPINDEMLRLTEEELSALFHSQGIMLTEQAKSEFYEYTGGWIFAAQLVCLSLKQNVLYKTNPFSAVELDIFSLLESEVFSVLSCELQMLLLKLSLLDCLPLDLAVQLAAGQQELIFQIIDISSFVIFDKFTSKICIHYLFRDFLEKRHGILSKSVKDEIYLMAAQWYEKNKYPIDAISQYEKIGYSERITGILLTFTRAYPAETMEFLLGVLERMPEEFLRQNPILRFLSIKYMMNNFRMEEVNKRLLELLQELELLPPTPELKAAFGEIYIHLAFQGLITSGMTHTYDFVRYFEMAHEYLPEGSKLIHNPYLSMGSYTCSVCSHKAGEIDKFIAALKEMLPFCKSLIPNTFEGLDTLGEAEFAYFKKDMKEAEKQILQVIRDSREDKNIYMEINALFLQTRISVALGGYKKAINALDHQRQLVKRINRPECYAVYDITIGWFYAQLGHTDLVSDWIRDEQRSREVMTPITFAADKLVRAKCLLHDNEIYELLALLNGKQEGFTFEYYLFGLIEMKVLKAIGLSLLKEYKESALVLQGAYELAVPNKIIMPFVENGKYMRTLINRVSEYTKIPGDWLEDIRIKSSTYAKRLSSIGIDFNVRQNAEENKPSLSHRELEVLRSLCQSLTREEIADAYGLSVNTVKSIINNIYGKLGVNNSLDAVRVAAHLNFL